MENPNVLKTHHHKLWPFSVAMLHNQTELLGMATATISIRQENVAQESEKTQTLGVSGVIAGCTLWIIYG